MLQIRNPWLSFLPLSPYRAPSGLSTGSVHIFGSAPVHLHLSVHPPSHKTSLISTSSAIKHLVFHSGRKRLVVVDAKSTVHVWKLDVMKQGGGGVWKEGTNSLYGTVTGVDISPSTSHVRRVLSSDRCCARMTSSDAPNLELADGPVDERRLDGVLGSREERSSGFDADSERVGATGGSAEEIGHGRSFEGETVRSSLSSFCS